MATVFAKHVAVDALLFADDKCITSMPSLEEASIGLLPLSSFKILFE